MDGKSDGEDGTGQGGREKEAGRGKQGERRREGGNGRMPGTGKRETGREDGTEAGEIEGEKAGRRKRDRPGNKAGTGERARHNLINKLHQASAVFGTEIDQQVMDWLQDRGYGASEYNNTDYCLKVLKMELLIRLFMDITYCSYNEAEPKIFYHFGKREKSKPSAAP